ncbi:MAG: hypothetical protein J6Y47_00790 [Bacteroidales bacterium]|nr:hypothetical protein [Bacteroidales bacterium]
MNKIFQTRILTILAVVLGILLLNSCQKEFTITATSNDATMGTVTGSGVYKKGTIVQLEAIPASGCQFEKWEDGNTDNPRSITVEKNATYTAVFFVKGSFSVSSTQRVLFASGNLQWSATGSHTVAGGGTEAGTWRFAPNQWDTIGAKNSNISSTYTDWIDLFGWGTSGYDNKYPYMLSVKVEDYGNGENDIAGTNYDWGVYNAIYNPTTNTTDVPGTWRTLTKDEWKYLLNTRPTSSNIRYAKGTVCGIEGLIIVPDDWNSSIYSLNDTNNKRIDYTSNTIFTIDWAKMESAGCVFLPADGKRNGTSVNYVGSLGLYWATTCNRSNGVYGLYFDSNNLDPLSFGNRSDGKSVRLVKDVK